MELKKKLYRYDEAAQLLSCSVDTVRRLVQGGELNRIFMGKSLSSARVTADSIETYIERKQQENGSLLHPG